LGAIAGSLGEVTPLDVQEIARDDTADIVLGKVAMRDAGFLTLCTELAPIGRSVCISGYPLHEISVNAVGGFELGRVRRYYRSTMIIDKVRATSGDKGRVHEGLLLQDEALFGQSGAPVFDADGVVIGMQASVTPARISEGVNRQIKVENAVVISSDKILALYERTLGLRTVVPKIDVAASVTSERRSA
jgi:hypothetical protein